MSFAVPLFAMVGLVAVCAFLFQTAIRVEKIRAEQRAEFQQNSTHSTP